ncbi:hypothetical protein HD806DRAFT_548941 [Xylariaceae sp. AK1471]|nr:hypothetical protein HD806DRAFT_548941 [Xylariaceae sp. AK1471]
MSSHADQAAHWARQWTEYAAQIDAVTKTVKLSRQFFDQLGPIGEAIFKVEASITLGGEARFFRDYTNENRVYLSTDQHMSQHIPCTLRQTEGNATSPNKEATGLVKDDDLNEEPERIKKTLNCFMLYQAHHRPLVQKTNPGITSGGTARLLAERWDKMSDTDKKPWVEEAAALRLAQKAKYPNSKCNRKKGGSRARKNTRRTFAKAKEASLDPTTPIVPQDVPPNEDSDMQLLGNRGHDN